MKGDSGLLDEYNHDIFSPAYPDMKLVYLRKDKVTADFIYSEILKKVFHSDPGAALSIVNLKKAEGEIALKAGQGKPFGLINIGDDSAFCKMVEKDEKCGIAVLSDDLSSSLFTEISKQSSSIYILIGAKKFMEGWNCWRVSNMGLLNIGKSEGSQIIQLFGRGVRLHGIDNKLKRSSHYNDLTTPEYISTLETLNIFGIKANYMEVFRERLSAEGIETERYIDYTPPIKVIAKNPPNIISF